MENLQYGLLGDKLVHIDDVERGLACGCLCPHCKAKLIAKKGNKNAKHFAHYKFADCNHGTETALHMMAKNILIKNKKVFVPFVPKTEYNLSNYGKVVLFDTAILEKQLAPTVRGDVVLYKDEQYLNVEIKVNHEVDFKKNIELFNLGIPTIEVDLSDIKSNFTTKMIEQKLLDRKSIRLVNSPKGKEIFAKWILGEWKTVYKDKYVSDCPLSRDKAYFVDYNSKGGANECHECNAGYIYANQKVTGKLLCYGCLDSIDFSKIEKILHLEKEKNHVCEVKLLMKDGSLVEKTLNMHKPQR